VDQLSDVIDKLYEELVSKSAVISLWDPSYDNAHGGSPCLNHLWFRIRDNKLYMTVVIRSNDMFGAFPANAYSMRRLQYTIARSLQERAGPCVTLGSLTILSESAHLYAHSWDDSEALIAEQYPKVIARERRKYADPKGSFIISLEGGLIRVDHISPGDGQVLQTLCGTNALELCRVLSEQNLLSDSFHQLYIGTELQKVEIALETGVEYVQDRPLKLID
jgi:thymidylate synthase